MNNTSPILFSIVTACKDQLDFVRETAQAILAQDHKEWEWLFVDDASKEDIAGFFASLNDPRIRYFRNETNQGQTKSLNHAIRESRGEWIVRIDGDDIPAIDRLRHTAEGIARSPEAQLHFSHYDVINEEGRALSKVRYRNELGASFYRYLKEKNNPLCHPSVCFRKHSPSGDLNLYDEKLRNAQDYELWKRILRQSPNSFALIPHSLISYRIVRGALSGARILEQLHELQTIRRAEDLGIKAGGSNQEISLLAREGMYAYRKIYFRFLDANKPSLTLFLRQMSDAIESLKFPTVAFKAFFFALAYPAKSIYKRFLFSGIYASVDPCEPLHDISSLNQAAPGLSIITVTYRDPEGLAATIKSLTQLHSEHELPFEQIIVDSSPELSRPVIDRLLADGTIYWKVTHHITKPEGVYSAMNAGVALAKRKAIWFLNGGDLLVDGGLLMKITRRLSESNEQVAYASATFHARNPKDSITIPRKRTPNRIYILNLLGVNHLAHQATVYRSEIFRKVGNYSLKYRIAADYEHHLRCYFAGAIPQFFQGTLASGEVGGISMTNWTASIAECSEVMRSYADQLPFGYTLLGRLIAYYNFIKMNLIDHFRRKAA